MSNDRRVEQWMVCASVLLVLVFLWLVAFNPAPNLKSVEKDIITAWVTHLSNDQLETLPVLIQRQGEEDQVREVIRTACREVEVHGAYGVVATSIESIDVYREGHPLPLATWRKHNPILTTQPTGPFADREDEIDLLDISGRKVGHIEIAYNLSSRGASADDLSVLPSLHRIEQERTNARIGAGIVLLLTGGMLKMFLRIAVERQRRLQMGRVMCHELRNLLTSVATEDRSQRHVCDQAEALVKQLPKAAAAVAKEFGLSGGSESVERIIIDHLACELVAPNELLDAAKSARRALNRMPLLLSDLSWSVHQLDQHMKLFELKPKPISVDPVLIWQNAVTMLSPRIEEVKSELTVDCDEPSPQVHADPQLLLHIFCNLILNAVEAKSCYPLVLRIRRLDSEIRCEVISHGSTPSPALLGKLFRVGATSRSGPGRGYGLFLVKQFVTRMKGRVSATVMSDGMQFVICLPAAGGQPDVPKFD